MIELHFRHFELLMPCSLYFQNSGINWQNCFSTAGYKKKCENASVPTKKGMHLV